MCENGFKKIILLSTIFIYLIQTVLMSTNVHKAFDLFISLTIKSRFFFTNSDFGNANIGVAHIFYILFIVPG